MTADQDVHDIPRTWDTARQHEVSRECWCRPVVNHRIDAPPLVKHQNIDVWDDPEVTDET